MAQIILSGLAYQPIAWDDDADAKAIWSGPLDFSKGNPYVMDITISNQLLTDKRIQSIYFHNPTANTVTVFVSGTNFVLKLQSNTGGLLPIIASDRPGITFTSSAASGIFQCWLLNVQALGYVYTLGS